MSTIKIRRIYKPVLASGLLLLGLSSAYNVAATTSTNVAIIGGNTLDCSMSSANLVTSGGCFPVTGSDLAGISFAPLNQAAVSAASLMPFDTVVLNVASPGMACNTNNLSTAAKSDLVDFVKSGKKLIIYDSECSPQNYGWLPYPFTTSNPGAMGAQGTLSLVENNPMGTWVGDPTCTGAGAADPNCINVQQFSTQTDAVGDMNVMTTFDPNWCVHMSGTNILGITGPVHTYANYPSGTDQGLMIYNGLDTDYLTTSSWGSPQWRQIWMQELKQPFNPSGLSCRITVVGITLDPQAATNEVGTEHTVTATLTDLLNAPQTGINVTFSITNGPNAGSAGGACDGGSVCVTDSNGKVNFTYKGDGGVGTDKIIACFNNGTQQVCSQEVEKTWVITNKAPDCEKAVPSISRLWSPNHKFVPINISGVFDPDGDSISLKVLSIFQDESVKALGSGNTSPDGKGVGTETAWVRAERVADPKIPGNGRVYHIKFEATDNHEPPASCTGEVLVGVPHDQGKGALPVDDGPIYDSTVQP